MTKLILTLTVGALLTGAMAVAQQRLAEAVVALVIGTVLAGAAALRG